MPPMKIDRSIVESQKAQQSAIQGGESGHEWGKRIIAQRMTDDKEREAGHLPHLPKRRFNPWQKMTTAQYEAAMEMRGREI